MKKEKTKMVKRQEEFVRKPEIRANNIAYSSRQFKGNFAAHRANTDDSFFFLCLRA